jgi:hypothetical protein
VIHPGAAKLGDERIEDRPKLRLFLPRTPTRIAAPGHDEIARERPVRLHGCSREQWRADTVVAPAPGQRQRADVELAV